VSSIENYKDSHDTIEKGDSLIRVKRAYDPTTAEDCFRILVDRFWPRGISKEKAKFDLWLKEIAPTDELRKWFGHDPQKWAEFQTKYRKELASKENLLKQISQLEKENRVVTLIYSARDIDHNNAVALKRILVNKEEKT